MKSHAITVGSGRSLDVTCPNTQEIQVDDIALSLSRKCRFGGFTREWFSVAQHSWNVAMHLRAFGAAPVIQLQGLMHDAQEAYLGDVATPHKDLFHGFREIEDHLQSAIFDRFGLPWPLDSKVRAVDELMLHVEAERLLPRPVPDWVRPGIFGASAMCDFSGWTHLKARHKFLDLFYSLDKDVQRESF